MFRSVKNWLTVLILALVALAMLVAYIYVIPPLTSRLEQQKLGDHLVNATLIGNTIMAIVGVFLVIAALYLGSEALKAFKRYKGIKAQAAPAKA